MVYKVTYDENENPLRAEMWLKLTIPPFELDANPNGFRFNGFAWVDADSEEEALTKANNLKKEI